MTPNMQITATFEAASQTLNFDGEQALLNQLPSALGAYAGQLITLGADNDILKEELKTGLGTDWMMTASVKGIESLDDLSEGEDLHWEFTRDGDGPVTPCIITALAVIVDQMGVEAQ